MSVVWLAKRVPALGDPRRMVLSEFRSLLASAMRLEEAEGDK